MFFGRYHRRFRAVFLQRLSSGGPPSNLLVPVLRRSLRTHASCFYPAGRFRVNKLWPRKPQQNARWVRPRGAARHSNRAGPNPLGENQSLSSPPLKPRRLLLSVMRQKVGKDRSQGVFAPLANPRNGPNLAELTPVCECPAAPQKTAMQNIATGSEQTFQPKDQPGSHYDGRRYPPRQAAIRRSTRRDCAFR